MSYPLNQKRNTVDSHQMAIEMVWLYIRSMDLNQISQICCWLSSVCHLFSAHKRILKLEVISSLRSKMTIFKLILINNVTQYCDDC